MGSAETNLTIQEKGQAFTVLVADDDPPTRILLRAAISQWGYSVVVAEDGEDAWKILQQPNPPRLLIVDWLMPKLNGIDLCLRIKEQLSYHPYTILLTQMTGTENIVKGLEAGADEFLSKPFNMVELNSRLGVGKRIVQYENLLALKNVEVEKYHTTIQTMLALENTLSDKLKHLVMDVTALAKTIDAENCVVMLTAFQVEFEKFIAVIKAFQ